MISYPEVYVFGRQVNGVYVEYSYRGPYGENEKETVLLEDLHLYNYYNQNGGEWKILKYGRPITVELNNKIKKES